MTITNKYTHQFEAFFNGDLNNHEKEAFEKALQRDRDMHLAWQEYKAMMEAFSDKDAISL